MKIIQKTIRRAYQHWSPCKEVRCYHFCGAFDGTKMICFTQNNPIKTHTGAYRIGENFNLPKYKEFPFYHSESHLVSKLLDSYNNIDPSWSIVVMRINRRGLILGSKPCENCTKLLESVGLNDIYYSTDSGDFCDSYGDMVFSNELTGQLAMV